MPIGYGEPILFQPLRTITLSGGKTIQWVRYPDGTEELYGGCEIREEWPVASCSRCFWEWYRRVDLSPR